MRFDADWKVRLSTQAWLPDKDEEVPHLPKDLYLEDLPESYERDKRLVELFGMKKDSIAKLAAEINIPVDVLNYAKENPEKVKQLIADDISGQKQRPDFPVRTSTNSERRDEKFREKVGGSPGKEYAPKERRVRITKGTIDSSLWLRNLYMNDSSQMVCQICKKEMPFKKRDGDYYFEAVEAFKRDLLPNEIEAQFLALCPLCAAMYKEFIKRDEAEMEELKEALVNGGDCIIPLRLGDNHTSLQFVETHFHDLKVILEKSD